MHCNVDLKSYFEPKNKRYTKNKININEATEEELLFFGFTKKELQNIEKWKNLKGDIFSNIDLIRIVGERRYEKLKNDIKY